MGVLLEEKRIESILEGILFAAGEPVEAFRLAAVMDVETAEINAAAARLADFYRYEQRGVRLLKLGDSYQLATSPDHADIIRRALETRKPPRLSPSLLEVLTIIAYFQPTTRGYVEQVRGVDSSHSFRTLMDRGLIEEAGKLAVPGRPTLFKTTPLFLKSFNLSSLEDLPPLPENGEDGQLSIDLKQERPGTTPGQPDGGERR